MSRLSMTRPAPIDLGAAVVAHFGFVERFDRGQRLNAGRSLAVGVDAQLAQLGQLLAAFLFVMAGWFHRLRVRSYGCDGKMKTDGR